MEHFVGSFGVPAEALDGLGDVDRPAIRDRLPRVQRVQARNLLGILLQELREP
jgi:hypothetical protein